MGKTPPHVKSQGGGRTRGRYEPPPKILSKKYVQVFEFQYISVECPPGGRLAPPGPRHSAAPGSVSSLGRAGGAENRLVHNRGALDRSTQRHEPVAMALQPTGQLKLQQHHAHHCGW